VRFAHLYVAGLAETGFLANQKQRREIALRAAAKVGRRGLRKDGTMHGQTVNRAKRVVKMPAVQAIIEEDLTRYGLGRERRAEIIADLGNGKFTDFEKAKVQLSAVVIAAKLTSGFAPTHQRHESKALVAHVKSDVMFDGETFSKQAPIDVTPLEERAKK